MEETNIASASTPQDQIFVDGKDISLPHSDWLGKCHRAPRKKNATFWKAFHIADDERNGKGKLYAVCNICGHVLISHNSGTTNLRRHMKSYHSAAFDKLLQMQETDHGNDGEESKKRSTTPSLSSTNLKKMKKGKSTMNPAQWAQLSQAMYCIASNRPFSDLNSPAMKRLVEACVGVGKANGKFLPDASLARSKATEAIQTAKRILTGKLYEANDLVLAIDFWETRINRNVAYISVRWIDGFQLRCCWLDAVKYSGPAKHDEIMARVQNVLKTWKIQDSISYIISNQELSQKYVGGQHTLEVIDCFDHILQGIIEASLSLSFEVPNKGDEEMESTSCRPADKAEKHRGTIGVEVHKRGIGEVIGKARRLARKLAAEMEPVTEDLVCRWWSSFAMIESLLKLKDTSEKDNIDLEDNEWETLEVVKEDLKSFAPAVKTLRDNNQCNSSIAPFLQFVIHSELLRAAKTDIQSDTTAVNKQLLEQCEAKLGKQVKHSASWCNVGLHKAFWLAHALDPRFKQLKILRDENERDALWDMLLDEMIALSPKLPKSDGIMKGKETKTASGDAEAASILRGVVEKEVAKREDAKEEDIFDQYAGVLESDPSPSHSNTWSHKCRAELKLYLAKSTVGMRTETGKEDPLSWWKSHRISFPTLWRLAKKYLAIPATSSIPKLTFNAEASNIVLERYELSHGLPSQSEFLHENVWLIEESLR